MSEKSISLSACNQFVTGVGFSYAFVRENYHLTNVSLKVMATQPNDIVKDGILFTNIAILCKPSEFYDVVDPYLIWLERSDNSIFSAIKIAAMKMGTGKNPIKFTVGAGFAQSVLMNQGFSDAFGSVFLQKCAQVVAQFDQIEVNDFHISADQNSAPRYRSTDNAKAKRMHVTTSGAAYRLLFWELADGSIELANIGPKKEEVIL